MTARRYHVPEVNCEGCQRSIEAALALVAGVGTVEVDLVGKVVVVTGEVTDAVIQSALTDAGYEVAGALSA